MFGQMTIVKVIFVLSIGLTIGWGVGGRDARRTILDNAVSSGHAYRAGSGEVKFFEVKKKPYYPLSLKTPEQVHEGCWLESNPDTEGLTEKCPKKTKKK